MIKITHNSSGYDARDLVRMLEATFLRNGMNAPCYAGRWRFLAEDAIHEDSLDCTYLSRRKQAERTDVEFDFTFDSQTAYTPDEIADWLFGFAMSDNSALDVQTKAQLTNALAMIEDDQDGIAVYFSRKLPPKPEEESHSSDPPRTVWLQWHGDGDPEDSSPVCESEVTWARDKVFGCDEEYARASDIRIALQGHECSELWGERGLLAATMSAVTTLEQLEDLVVDATGTAEETLARIRKLLTRVS